MSGKHRAQRVCGRHPSEVRNDHARRTCQPSQSAAGPCPRRHLALVLQTTNILRDVRDDHAHGHIFYPRSLFDCFDARKLVAPEMKDQVLLAGVRMIRWLMPAIRGAGEYILALPAGERRIRSFCIIPYVMALKTIMLCLGNEALLSQQSVKMNRRGVMRTQYFSRLFAPLESPLRWWLSKFWVRLESRLDTLGG